MTEKIESTAKCGGRYISSKSDLKTFLNAESKKYKRKNTSIPFFAITENQILWKHSVLLRKTEYYTNTNHRIMRLIYVIRLTLLQNKYCLHIPINCFDCGLKIMHLGPVIVNRNARVGKDCSMHMNTSIAAAGTSNGVPTLGNGIVIGIGAVVLGDIKLADYIAIGANAVVNKSFDEENIAIAGVPAKKISNNGSKEWEKK